MQYATGPPLHTHKHPALLSACCTSPFSKQLKIIFSMRKFAPNWLNNTKVYVGQYMGHNWKVWQRVAANPLCDSCVKIAASWSALLLLVLLHLLSTGIGSYTVSIARAKHLWLANCCASCSCCCCCCRYVGSILLQFRHSRRHQTAESDQTRLETDLSNWICMEKIKKTETELNRCVWWNCTGCVLENVSRLVRIT